MFEVSGIRLSSNWGCVQFGFGRGYQVEVCNGLTNSESNFNATSVWKVHLDTSCSGVGLSTSCFSIIGLFVHCRIY